MSYGFQISGSETTLGQIFEKKIFGPQKKFRTLFPEKIGKKSPKTAKNGIFEALKAN